MPRHAGIEVAARAVEIRIGPTAANTNGSAAAVLASIPNAMHCDHNERKPEILPKAPDVGSVTFTELKNYAELRKQVPEEQSFAVLVKSQIPPSIQISPMNQGSLTIKPFKTQYSEHEAAQELGVSLEQLRTLIRSHIVETDDDLNNVPMASFHPSDLLVLKLLLNSKAIPTTED